MGIVLHAIAGLGYAFLALLDWRSLATSPSAGAVPTRSQWLDRSAKALATRLFWLVLVLHAAAIAWSAVDPEGLRLGFALGLSITLWLATLVYGLESRFAPVGGIRLPISALAASICLLAVAFPSVRLVPAGSGAWLPLHLMIALSAYGMITLVALHAMVMALADRYLHHRSRDGVSTRGRVVQALLEGLPPLLALERILFRLLGLGFILLSLTVVTGSLFNDQMHRGLLNFDHKTIFTVLAWLTFGVLLVGRSLRGWRGRTALRFILTGFVLLILAYAGSRFVIEVLLGGG